MDLPPHPPEHQPSVKELLEQLDAHTRAMREAQADDRASLREGVYMILFQAGLIATLGAMYGFLGVVNARALRLRPGRRALDFWAQRAQDASDCWRGLLMQLAEYWWLDVALLVVVALIALRIASRRARRRWFKLAVASTSLLMVLPTMSKLLEVMNG